MKSPTITPYLNFNGNCREAMQFYAACLDAKVEIMPFAGSPVDVPAEASDKVLHAFLQHESLQLMASDCPPGTEVTVGSNVALSINCGSREEVERYFTGFGEGGKITMPLEDTFWGAYFGMLIDKFGIPWMFNFDSSPQS